MWTYLENYFNIKKSFVFYGSYHHEWRDKIVHVIFVPTIFTTALAILSKVPITENVNLSHAVAAFYIVSFIVMEPLAGTLYAPLLTGMQYLAQHVCAKNLAVCGVLNVVGWVAQVLAHRFFEHRAPAFTEDPPQAFHSAVFFVWLEVLYALGYRPKERDELEALVLQRIKKMDAEKANQKPASASA